MFFYKSKYSTEKAAFMRKCLGKGQYCSGDCDFSCYFKRSLDEETITFFSTLFMCLMSHFFFSSELSKVARTKESHSTYLIKDSYLGIIRQWRLSIPLHRPTSTCRCCSSWKNSQTAPKTVNFNFSSSHFYTVLDKHPLWCKKDFADVWDQKSMWQVSGWALSDDLYNDQFSR